jgi:hypothetical protein
MLLDLLNSDNVGDGVTEDFNIEKVEIRRFPP